MLKKFINDDKTVSTFCGCLIGDDTISSLIYHRYWNSLIEYPDIQDYENFVINDTQVLRKMDSIILYSKKPGWILVNRALENRVYSDKYKTIIYEWAFKKQNIIALEYIYKNLKTGNELALKRSLEDYLKSKDIPEYRIKKIREMLKKIL